MTDPSATNAAPSKYDRLIAAAQEAPSAVTIVAYLFTTGFQAGDLGYASAIGWMLVIIILTITMMMYLLGVKEKRA